ncbi:transposase IS630 [Acetobacter senegalensis]|uniref:Transposase IS630 n=1 Tax=Acetobacter senegalensis TaxID=446692 RepID=A0A0U5EZ73_9PROT|nr:transposase IS630 [Acetobacter senegalensis]
MVGGRSEDRPENKADTALAKRGTRPRVTADLRTRSAWIFGAICPAQGKGAALVLPSCNIHAMNVHLQETTVVIYEYDLTAREC